MTDRTTSSSGSSLFPSLLAVLFIGLKLTGYINWPWVWVLAPLWIPLGLVGILLLIAFVLILIIGDD